ncbi:transcription termination factor Rho [Streptomyces sp. A7024]|uniref:Transcription termination factor Rho n=1 Tax=Streptomyces coryli TaxID=1128680 RepID=A0A6G4U4R7_9ACTN|nr:transcription termination factor Rho [Streptomyces coryli]NGN66277.1 transcription termination factor Rho [Streptomyces coryli]
MNTTELEPTHVSGVVDLAGSNGFLRTEGLLPGPDDVHIPQNLIRRHGLRRGDLVAGTVKPAGGGRDGRKAPPLDRVDSVNGGSPEVAARRPKFADLTPLYPQDRIRLENGAAGLTNRVIDLVSPVGKGQRGMIVAPPKTGKTMILQSIAAAIETNHPECHLMVVLLDERPEEVTDMRRTITSGEVLASTFDRPAKDHTTLADLAIERAKRMVEEGKDVVILLDSLTRLCRAYNNSAPGNGRTLSGGVDAGALHHPKRIFGAARNIEDGGSLTILATALVETGSRADDYYFEELKSTGNMELRLDRSLADKRVFPAVDVDPSGTRREEIITSTEELDAVRRLRRALSERDGQGTELLLTQLKKTDSNAAFLRQLSLTTAA